MAVLATQQIDEGMSTAYVNNRDVWQGCSLSTLLGSLTNDAMVREATGNMHFGVAVRGNVDNMIRKVDDKAVVFNSQGGLW